MLSFFFFVLFVYLILQCINWHNSSAWNERVVVSHHTGGFFTIFQRPAADIRCRSSTVLEDGIHIHRLEAWGESSLTKPFTAIIWNRNYWASSWSWMMFALFSWSQICITCMNFHANTSLQQGLEILAFILRIPFSSLCLLLFSPGGNCKIWDSTYQWHCRVLWIEE